MGIKSRTIIETGAREPLAGLGKHLDCALMNLFDKSSAVHRYSVRPSSPPKRLQPILFTLIIHPQQKKAIRQNSNLHSPLLRTNKFQVCAQISGQAAARANPILGAVGEKMCKSRKANSSEPDVTTGLNSDFHLFSLENPSNHNHHHRNACFVKKLQKKHKARLFPSITSSS